MTLAQLREKRQELFKEMTAIRAAVKAAGDTFTDEQRVRLKELFAQDEDCQAQITKIEDDLELSTRIEAHAVEAARSYGRKTTPDGPKAPVDPHLSDPKRGFGDHREYLVAVMNAATGRIDPRLKPLAIPQAAAGSDEQGVYSDPYGGFLVPTGFSPTLLTVDPEGDPTAGRTTAIPMNQLQIDLPARVDKNHTNSVSGGLRVYRASETEDVTSSRMEFEKVKLTANELIGIAYASERVLAYSAISFVAMLSAGFSDEFNAKIIKEKLFGTGTGEMEGINGSAATISIAKESGQAANTINFDNIVKMRARCWRYGNAIWVANHDTLPQLMKMNSAVGSGGTAMIWLPSAREDAPDTLLGRPLFFSEFCKTLGTTGDIFCWNPTQYLEGSLGAPTSAESIHVRFLNNERTFRFHMMNDGRCWWRSALTVNQGSNSLSPQVKLDTRA